MGSGEEGNSNSNISTEGEITPFPEQHSQSTILADQIRNGLNDQNTHLVIESLAEGITPFPNELQFTSFESERLNTLYEEMKSEIRLFQKSLMLLGRLKEPTVIGTIAASSLGLLSMMVTKNQEISNLLSNASLYGGMAILGAGKGEGLKGRALGALTAAATVPLIQNGIHHLPMDQHLGNFVAGQMDDIANVGKLSALSVGAVVKREGK